MLSHVGRVTEHSFVDASQVHRFCLVRSDVLVVVRLEGGRSLIVQGVMVRLARYRSSFCADVPGTLLTCTSLCSNCFPFGLPSLPHFTEAPPLADTR